MLYRIILKNQNKFFWTIGQFEFEYFGSSDVVNKLLGILHFKKAKLRKHLQQSVFEFVAFSECPKL